MSSTNKTTYLKMHSWVRTDPVVCEDFNENFNKIDSAIGDMRAKYGGCEIYTGAYVGNNAKTLSLTFPKVPVFFMVQKDDLPNYYSGFIREDVRFPGQNIEAMVSISGNTVTFTDRKTEGIAFNYSGANYHYIAFAPAQQ